MMRTLLFGLAVVIAAPASAQIQLIPARQATPVKKGKEGEPVRDDTKALSEAKLSADDSAGLLAYLRGRTLSNEDMSKIQAVIQRMGSESFDERVKASTEAIGFGAAAIGPLKTAATSTDVDPEIRFRALETLRTIEKLVSHAAVASAVARALAKSKPPEATATLLAFLPNADNGSVDEDIRTALKALAIRDGKLDAALTAGLQDSIAIRRAAAAVALIEASVEQKTQKEEVVKLVAAMLKPESDSDAKFRVSYSLATTARSPDAIRGLVEVLPSLARGQIWQVEDILLQLAGANPPKIKLKHDKASLETARNEWLAWLEKNKTADDFAKFEYKPRTNGRLLMLWQDQQWGNMGRIVELGPDLKQRGRMNGVNPPADFRVLPDGYLEILEHNWNRLVERDFRGNQRNMRNLPGGQPVSLERDKNGKILVGYAHQVVEYDANWKQLKAYPRPNHDCRYALRHTDGTVLVLVQDNNAGNKGEIIRLDDKFKEMPKPVKTGVPNYQAKMELLPNGNVLITEQNAVHEYDLKTGKSVWNFTAQYCSCVQRLPNGNTLVCDFQNRAVKEVTPEKDVLWTYQPPENLHPLRAYRQ